MLPERLHALPGATSVRRTTGRGRISQRLAIPDSVLWISEVLMRMLIWPFDEDARFPMRQTSRAGGRRLDTSPTNTDLFVGRNGQLTVLEICAGAGGQALGLHASGFQPLALYEMDEDAVNTLKLNKAGRWNIIQADIRTVDFRQYKGIDLLAVVFPARAFPPR